MLRVAVLGREIPGSIRAERCQDPPVFQVQGLRELTIPEHIRLGVCGLRQQSISQAGCLGGFNIVERHDTDSRCLLKVGQHRFRVVLINGSVYHNLRLPTVCAGAKQLQHQQKQSAKLH